MVIFYLRGFMNTLPDSYKNISLKKMLNDISVGRAKFLYKYSESFEGNGHEIFAGLSFFSNDIIINEIVSNYSVQDFSDNSANIIEKALYTCAMADYKSTFNSHKNIK